MKEILQNQLPIEILINKPQWVSQFNDNQIHQIRRGLEKNLNVSVYAKPELTWEQMDEIRERLYNEKKYSKTNFQLKP